MNKQVKLDASPVSSLVGGDYSGIISMLVELRTRYDTFEANLDNKFKRVISRLDDFHVRIESASSQQIEVEILSGRVDDL